MKLITGLENGELFYTGKKKKYYGGYYLYEIDAAKRINQLCDEVGIQRKNPKVDAMPNKPIKNGCTSQYRGVSWSKDRKRWKVTVKFEGKHNASYHVNEVDAAKRVNQVCDELGIERKNPEVDAMPNKEIKDGMTSQYTGVCLKKDQKRWTATIYFKHQRKVSYHANELDAARRVNQWCDEFGIKRKNPYVDSTPNKREDCKILLDYDVIKQNLEI